MNQEQRAIANPFSFDLRRLQIAYATGEQTPLTVMQAVLGRIAAAGEDRVWISRRSDAALLLEAAALTARGPEGLALWGVPFAIKDNLDLAGLPTTAACPAYAYMPDCSAVTVERLAAAGAIAVGKTNMDQFATGLVGTRSPYGTPRNPFDPAMLPGGSSSGSAVAVAAGLVSVALGTDTAGSGRVPAGFCNLVGLKPTRGWLSTRGLVPACRSLDCVSVLALTVEDALAVAAQAGGHDREDAYGRVPPPGFDPHLLPQPLPFRFGVPRAPRFFGDREAEALYSAALDRAEAAGGTRVPVDLAPFEEAASLLYGPWAAERAAAVGAFLDERPAAFDPVVRGILQGGAAVDAVALFRAQHRLAAIAQATRPAWDDIDALLLPTTGTAFTVAQVLAEPLARNAELGATTNFVNLLDLAAIAVPCGFTGGGFPVGITLVGPAWHDARLAGLADRLHRAVGTALGATGHTHPGPPELVRGRAIQPWTELAVFGAHLADQPLNGDLRALGGRFRRACATRPCYRMLVLPGSMPRPGLVRAADGAALQGEVWAIPTPAVGAFLGSILPPLGLGTVDLEDGPVPGFICEAGATGEDITAHGGWRAWRDATAR